MAGVGLQIGARRLHFRIICQTSRRMSVVPLTPVLRPGRLAEEVGADLERRIRRGDFPPGGRLPSESQLAAQFGVSRTVVREAIARLRAEGLVDSRQGAGAFVMQRPGAASFRLRGMSAEPRSDAEVFELRLVVEAAVAERAARRHTAADLAAIAGALARMDAALRAGEGGAEADDAFHRAIAAACGNALLQRLVEFVSQDLSASRRPTWSRDGLIAGRALRAQDEHRALFEAIAAGDGAAARCAAEQHLIGTAARLGVSWFLDPASPSKEPT